MRGSWKRWRSSWPALLSFFCEHLLGSYAHGGWCCETRALPHEGSIRPFQSWVPRLGSRATVQRGWIEASRSSLGPQGWQQGHCPERSCCASTSQHTRTARPSTQVVCWGGAPSLHSRVDRKAPGRLSAQGEGTPTLPLESRHGDLRGGTPPTVPLLTPLKECHSIGQGVEPSEDPERDLVGVPLGAWQAGCWGKWHEAVDERAGLPRSSSTWRPYRRV